MTLTYVALGLLLAPHPKPFGFKTLAISRHRLRLLANKLGVRQRSLYFALVTHALNGDGDKKQVTSSHATPLRLTPGPAAATAATVSGTSAP